ncbi:hypothetical protein FMM05_00045 [Flavobacterium zepuense]|uniref:Uncharacterized protein n=1 Tax=Flavobacterium zepuense TaxID=2593302 RepID=A0A552V9D1_9FLAO|nr:hypothetical protein [Flavobacterium zepuense]TRW27076.1 hypothetical protein FMM05_00045 [Flavobacterium zepuense]
MKKILFVLLVITGCQTTCIKDKTYKVSEATIELGTIGRASSMYDLDNGFSIHSIPILQNKIRLDIQVLPFTKAINKIYINKTATNPSVIKVNYADSLPVKPEYITVSIMDRTGFANELNAEYNGDIATYLKDTKKTVAITGMALVLPGEELAKIKSADAYYLLNSQDKKYTIALYKAGKKTETIELGSSIPLAYTLGKFCWAVNDRQQWYIGEIVEDNKSCKGNTKTRVEDKEEKNLFKL